MLQRAPKDHDYWSVDSAPAKLTRPLSVWAAPSLLLIFTVVAALAAMFPNGDVVFSPYLGVHSIPLRIFIVSFFVAF